MELKVSLNLLRQQLEEELKQGYRQLLNDYVKTLEMEPDEENSEHQDLQGNTIITYNLSYTIHMDNHLRSVKVPVILLKEGNECGILWENTSQIFERLMLFPIYP